MRTNVNKRVIFLSISGTIMEWMDYTLYGYFANIIGLEFFPHTPLQERLLWVFGVFASGFLLRPLGAIIFGHYADRNGRKKAIILTILITGLSTIAMGVLPGYAKWGLFSTAMLFLLRLIQSLAIAGENGVTVYLLEHTKRNPNFMGSLIGTASSIGMFISSFLVMLFTNGNLPVWSWRLPYILGGIACVAVSFMRYSIEESPQFLRAAVNDKIRKVPFLTAITKRPGAVITTLSFAGFMGLYTYVCNIYFHTYLITYVHVTNHIAAIISTFGQIVAVSCIPLAGMLADRYGKINILLLGLIAAIIIPPQMFILANTHRLYNMYLAMFLYGIGMGLSLAPMFKFLFDLFPTEIRFSGYTASWNISVAIFGGTAPLVSQIFANYHAPDFAGIYVSISAFIALLITVKIALTDKLKRLRYKISI
jgi:MHS family proline/betaine transporter-like MFS transporter